MKPLHFVLLLPLLLTGSCARAASPGAPAASPLSSVLIQDVPHVPQKPDFCGEACVEMWLGKLGKPGDQDWVFDQSGLDPTLGRGAYSRELAQALERIGFRAGRGWYPVRADDAGELHARFRELHEDLTRGVPSIVCMHSHDGPDATEHFRLILGYDAKTDEIVYHEPAAERAGAYRQMPRALFLKLWPLKYEPTRWTVIRFRLEPGDLRRGEASKTPTPADYAQHVMALKAKLPPGFHVAITPPFVVIGDSGPESVRRWARGTVSWAVEKLKARYFEHDPGEILDVWLFKDNASYRKHTRELFGDEPETPYGYYSPEHRALIMNIATGGGTLVHEIVHPYVRANFPEAPAWLNEGLGSLYEQSSEEGGHIVGLTNWRLEGLQNAIRARRVPSFRALTGGGDRDFYSRATSYAHARYLLYYLQEKGLLVDFYKRFHAARREDPTGYRTLQAVLGEADMADFQRRWEAWVLTLKFGG
ncbi:MAG TPA: C39 family peptidase [Myxococcaceae bacterium]|nr:C39 family peptidase [Myxococcaceae bacterium]